MCLSNALSRHFPTLSVLRRHPSPSRQQFDGLLAIAEAVGIELEVDNSKKLAASLDRATREDDPYFNKLLRILSTRWVGRIHRHRTPHLPSIVFVLPRAWATHGIAVGTRLCMGFVYVRPCGRIRRLQSRVGVVVSPCLPLDVCRASSFKPSLLPASSCLVGICLLLLPNARNHSYM